MYTLLVLYFWEHTRVSIFLSILRIKHVNKTFKVLEFLLNQLQKYCGYLCNLLSFIYNLLTANMFIFKLTMSFVCFLRMKYFWSLDCHWDYLHYLWSFGSRQIWISWVLCIKTTYRQIAEIINFWSQIDSTYKHSL